jgi:outer membrane lipoprotein-sorting protein
MSTVRIVGGVMLYCVAQVVGAPCAACGPEEGEKILNRVEAQFEKIRDYTVTVDVVADVERLKIPPMHLTMYYKQPDKVHFDSEGIVLLPREGMALPFSKLSRRFAVDSVGTERTDSVVFYRLVLRARDERVRTRKLILVVDPRRWTPQCATAPFQDGSSMTARFEYSQIGEIWMPSRLAVTFKAAPRDTVAAAPAPAATSLFGEAAPAGRFVPPRAGSIIVTYSEYKINTGLSDDIFVPERK